MFEVALNLSSSELSKHSEGNVFHLQVTKSQFKRTTFLHYNNAFNSSPTFGKVQKANIRKMYTVLPCGHIDPSKRMNCDIRKFTNSLSCCEF